ncbi:unnamed protein product [Rotaria sp. Silwood2]|nr:unnamed protein product [Rotaria sp. Silwood2]
MFYTTPESMLIMYMMIFLALHHAVHTQYSLYYSDIRSGSYLTFDCLYDQFIEGEKNVYSSYIMNKQLISYCRRPDSDEQEEEMSDISDENIANTITFKELSKQGITSEQLLNWSAPMDVAERYAMNNKSSELFYNCSFPWFGSKCQYRFVYNTSLSFHEIVQASMKSRNIWRITVNVTTCYRFLSDCNRGPWPLCLDWRQICNGKADCMHGEDEQGCEILEMTTCSHNEYRCLYGGQCIPMSFAQDSSLSVDCLDGSEEKEIFEFTSSPTKSICYSTNAFRCTERISRYPHTFPCGDGEFLTEADVPSYQRLCSNGRDMEATLAVLTSFHHIEALKCRQAVHCSIFSNQSYNITVAWYCYYGILILLNDANQTKKCLCPPNYFGSRCQWQGQRVSLTLQFRTEVTVVSPIIFQLIIMLIDEQGKITPNHEQITYIPDHDCNTKFNIYLLYPHRPKRASANYSIRIDLFDKLTLEYWTSYYLPIPFQFLPVNRIATQLIISEKRENELCILSCGEHGQCMKYTNMNNSFFCRCHPEYSGAFCNITHQCKCSNDSLCLAESICVCSLNKFGPHCYLKRSICQSTNNICEHNRYCISLDDRINLNAFMCICKEGYHGERCQYKNNRIDIRIDGTIIEKSSSFILHSIIAFNVITKHERLTTLKKIAFGYNTMTISVRQSFNILLIQIPDGDYYLAVLREKFIQSEFIHTNISSENLCYPVLELFNNTFRQYEYLRRVKYYPLLCRQYSKVMCFYDEYNMCVCDSDRFSNCFEFNNTLKYDCSGKNLCYNDGRCFLNNETCPTTFICVCNDCFYGSQCQFSTKDFIFSLDPILGYHIKPNISLNQQPFIIIFSILITTIMLILQLIMGSLSVATFKLKKSREVGCGYYLLASSITSMCMIIVLLIKFWQLILSQMSIITNRSMLSINCKSIEIILKSCLASTEWLNACVSIERIFTVINGISFNKKESRIMAKRVIFVVIVVTIITHIHDPLRRRLIDDLDGDQQRVWCLSQYSSTLTKYNTFITIFHFLIPFAINMTSAFIIIILTARSRTKIKTKETFMKNFRLKIKQNKHIIIAPSVLLLLGLPRLTISFTSGCMRSPRQSWLYLIGYFASFIPSALTLIIFILPSETYKKEFDKIRQAWFRRFCSRS